LSRYQQNDDLGSLAVVVLTTIGRPQQIRVAILLRFSAVALPGAGIVVAAGLIAAWLYLGKVSDLWLTDYGRVLALKACIVGAISVCGFLNWRGLRRRQGFSWLVATEVALAALVAIVSGFLTEIAHP
jgi:putative copper export protein